jgi:hypothetical protein
MKVWAQCKGLGLAAIEQLESQHVVAGRSSIIVPELAGIAAGPQSHKRRIDGFDARHNIAFTIRRVHRKLIV